jgi:uncharacterized protein (TIGR00297 family)
LLTVLPDIAYFFLVIAFALTAVLLKAIDGRGFLASVVVGFAVIYGGGLPWFVIVAVFFSLGVAVTWYKYGYKKKLGSAQEKGGARNWPNILANGGFASIFAVCSFFRPGSVFAALFLGSISAAAADTTATELGLLSERQPRLITHPAREVPPGTSGGVSPLGFVGALLASLVIGGMALVLGVMGASLQAVALCVVGGVVGAVVDSLLGASVQRKGFCKVCLRQTEAIRHCGEKTSMTGGVSFIENNMVNVLATAAGAASALVYLMLVLL